MRTVFVEGCLVETFASAVAREEVSVATDPAMKRVLERIADDEERHAQLAWRAMAWITRTFGDAAISPLVRELAQLGAPIISEADTPSPLRAHGVPAPRRTSSIRAAVIREVVQPTTDLVMRARPSPRRRGDDCAA